MTISEISKALEVAVKAIELKDVIVKEVHDKRAAVVAEHDKVCDAAVKGYNDAIAEAHKLRDALHAELAKVLPAVLGIAGVIKGISK